MTPEQQRDFEQHAARLVATHPRLKLRFLARRWAQPDMEHRQWLGDGCGYSVSEVLHRARQIVVEEYLRKRAQRNERRPACKTA